MKNQEQKKNTKKTDKPKVMTSDRISKSISKDVSSSAIVEVVLLKKHGFDEKGTVLERHPNTAGILIDKGIAKLK